MTSLLRLWSEISIVLRRHPLLDYVMAAVLGSWGAAALLMPDRVLHHSRFGALHGSILLAGAIALLAGCGQAWVAHVGRPRWRITASFVALWVMLSLWFTVDSITGKISRGGHVPLDLLLSLALVP